MKKIFFIFTVLIGFLAVKPVFAEEAINNFQADFSLKQDGTVRVVETIDYNFGSAERHGIFRDIPYDYKTPGGNYKLRLGDISVSGPDGLIKFSQSRADGVLKLQIGDETQTVSGVKRYVISYTVRRAINFFDNQDEFYWNLTGNGWTVPLDSASARIRLPTETDPAQLKTACYVGAAGGHTSCNNISFLDSAGVLSDSRAAEVEFRQNGLAAGEGLTIIIALPKGLLAEPNKALAFLYLISDNYIIVLPIIVLVLMLYFWYTRGRDPAGRGTIVTQYEAPDGLTPAEVGTIVDEEADNLDISAELIHLAVGGYLKINRIKEKGLMFDSEDYQFEKLKDPNDLTNDFDRYLITGIFKGRDQVKLSELKKTIYKDLARIKEMIYQATVQKGYFKGNPGKTKTFFLLLGGVFFVIGFNLVESLGMIHFLSFAVTGLIVGAIGWFMPARTLKGVAAREQILGFKKYLQVAEKERLEFHNAPEKNPTDFEKLLPYAMCLKVEKQWAGQFGDVYKDQYNSWYGSYNYTNFSAEILIADLQNFASKSTATLGASAAGHKSGFGAGGGFSGGGFGGGGGGSW
jgi:uncharacterized membrane protein YgcG